MMAEDVLVTIDPRIAKQPDRRPVVQTHQFEVWSEHGRVPEARFTNMSCAANTACFCGLSLAEGGTGVKHWVVLPGKLMMEDIRIEETGLRC